MRPVARALLLALLLPVLPAGAEEADAEAGTIWLRGRGSDVWIERGAPRDGPRDERKGLTRVAARDERKGLTRVAARDERKGLTRVAARDERAAPPRATVDAVPSAHRHPIAVALGEPHWAHDGGVHDYTPYVYYPRSSYRLHRSYRWRHHGHSPHGWYPGWHGHAHRSHRSHLHGGSHAGFHEHGAWRDRPHHRPGHGPGHDRAPSGPMRAYRNDGPYGGATRSGGHVLRGGAHRKVR